MTTLNETLAAFTKLGSIFRYGGGQELDGKTNGADIFLCAIITKQGETAPDLDLCDYNEMPDGVVTGLANDATDFSKDASSPIATDTNIKYRDITKDSEVILVLGAGRGATINYIACLDHDNPGFVEAMIPSNESIAAVPPFRMLGRFMATYTAVVGKARHAWVKGK